MSAGGVMVAWTAPPERVAARIQLLGARFSGMVDTVCIATALDAERYAKTNAPWKNQTGMARATLRGTSNVRGASGDITIAHGMDYGIWLEVANGRRFGILPQTLDHAVGFLDRQLDGLLDRAAAAS